jgi:cyclophilin family peptidyl-prolyl cis-trans isomerase
MRRAGMLTAILLLALWVSACGGTTPPADATVAPDPTVTPTAEVAVLVTPVPVPEEVEVEATVAPPVMENPGPAASLSPLERNGMYDAPPEQSLTEGAYYYATLKTNRGDIRVQLFADRAPITVNNFVFLARQGYYDGTIFHRVLDGFMAQAGDPTGTGTGGPGYDFEDEFYPGLIFDRPGLLAMANRGPATNGSQFFITFGETEWLNYNHTIFGEVIEGDEIMSRITRRDPASQSDIPGDIIYTILIDEAGESTLPTPTPAPPTPTPLPTPTPYAPSSLDDGERPLAAMPARDRVNLFNTAPELVIDPAATYRAVIRTSKGDLGAALYAAEAPLAVNNFVVLAKLGFYHQTPISLVRPGDSVIMGAPDDNPLNDAGYSFPAELGAVTGTDVGAITYIPVEQLPDGTILSSSSQLLIALVAPPEQVELQLAFFAQIDEGLEVLAELTTADSILAIEIIIEE